MWVSPAVDGHPQLCSTVLPAGLPPILMLFWGPWGLCIPSLGLLPPGLCFSRCGPALTSVSGPWALCCGPSFPPLHVSLPLQEHLSRPQRSQEGIHDMACCQPLPVGTLLSLISLTPLAGPWRSFSRSPFEQSEGRCKFAGDTPGSICFASFLFL